MAPATSKALAAVAIAGFAAAVAALFLDVLRGDATAAWFAVCSAVACVVAAGVLSGAARQRDQPHGDSGDRI